VGEQQQPPLIAPGDGVLVAQGREELAEGPCLGRAELALEVVGARRHDDRAGLTAQA